LSGFLHSLALRRGSAIKGGGTTSITYVPVSPQNPQGYILHLKSNYNYRLRGTQYPQEGQNRLSGFLHSLALRRGSAIKGGGIFCLARTLQMGLNVLGSGGKRVREVRTWVLRCHACFK
jgi:hypothetical protein